MILMILAGNKRWLWQSGPGGQTPSRASGSNRRGLKGFDFDVVKAEQIFDLLLKEKQLKLPENHKLPTTQELRGRPYCKWHHSFTHATNDCRSCIGRSNRLLSKAD